SHFVLHSCLICVFFHDTSSTDIYTLSLHDALPILIKKMTTGAGKCIEDVGEINAIGHRIVHGGEKFQSSCVITDEVVDALRELRSEEHTSELQSRFDLVCRLLLEKKKILGLVHQRT